MQNFQDSFKIRKRSFISTFSICMIVPLISLLLLGSNKEIIKAVHFQIISKLENIKPPAKIQRTL